MQPDHAYLLDFRSNRQSCLPPTLSVYLQLGSVVVAGLEPFSLFVVSGLVSFASLMGLGAVYLTERVHSAPPTLALVTLVTSILVTVFVSVAGIRASRTTRR